LAAFYPAYVYNAASVITVIEGERFLSRGSAVVHPGWTEVYGKDERGGENALPSLSEGEVRTAVSVVKEKKKTQPPKPYTEAALLSAMERAGRFVEDEELKESLKENGLGTPATRAAIIERLLEVGYVVRKGKTLAPTEKGVSLISVVPKELKSPETTGKWEKALSMIAKGEMEPAKFIGSIERYVKFIVEHAKESETEAAFPDENKRRAAQTRLKRKVKS
jgi:DNA topoisomerase-3